ncbi:MAG: outer membrane protein [Chlorobiota bacterium]
MKSIIKSISIAIAKITIITSLIVLNFNLSSAQTGTDLHFKGGLSTPNDKIASVYSDENLTTDNITSGDLFNENSNLGYHVGLGLRVGISDMFDFVGGVEFHRFTRSEFKIKDPESREIYTMRSTQNIFPVNAGVNLKVINTDIFGVYGTAGLAYNYISNSVDYLTEESDFSVPLDLSPDDSRVGYFIGAGTDVNVGLLKLNLEIKYQHINFLGKEDGEEDKQFLAVSLGVIL